MEVVVERLQGHNIKPCYHEISYGAPHTSDGR